MFHLTNYCSHVLQRYDSAHCETAREPEYVREEAERGSNPTLPNDHVLHVLLDTLDSQHYILALAC